MRASRGVTSVMKTKHSFIVAIPVWFALICCILGVAMGFMGDAVFQVVRYKLGTLMNWTGSVSHIRGILCGLFA